MWQLVFLLLSSVALMQTYGSLLSSRVSIPGLPGMDLNLAPLLNPNNFMQFSTGFGMFNLGTEVQKMQIILHTSKQNYSDAFLVPERPPSFLNSSWDKTQKTIIIIHGYAEDASGGPFSPTKKVFDAYGKAKRPENLLFVDWRFLARQADYFTSAKNTVKAGMRVAELLISLRNTNFISNLDNVHFVGFSLGAHVSAIAAYYANALFDGEKVGRITGLDPAGPGFRNVDLTNRLDPSDATFVDVIHTNMGNMITTFGTPIKSGHVDFYPNGGSHQPGCEWMSMVPEFFGVCSHIKAADYYSNSILGTTYLGCPCADWTTYQKGSCQCTNGAVMGEFADPSVPGDYYLTIPLGQ